MFTAQIIDINDETASGVFDTVAVFRDGEQVDTLRVESSEDGADYDAALADEGYTDVEWLESGL